MFGSGDVVEELVESGLEGNAHEEKEEGEDEELSHGQGPESSW